MCVRIMPVQTCRRGGSGDLHAVGQVQSLAVHQFGAEDEFAS